MITAPKCETKTTKNLLAGDVILDGNIFAGFVTKTFIKAVESPHNNKTMLLTFQYDSGAISPELSYGKNTRWSVILK